MNNHQESGYEKLVSGQKLLNSGTDDHDMLGMALIKLHGALEDRMRELLSARLPHMRDEINDRREFQWGKIVDLAKQHLGLSDADGRLILEANYHRQRIAHGDPFAWNRDGVRRYEQLILGVWDTGARARPAYSAARSASYTQPRPRQSTRPADPPEIFFDFSRPQPAPAAQAPSYAPANPTDTRPWYRSTGFYWLIFVLFNPLWAALILTDRNQSGLVKAFAVIFVLFYTAIACTLCSSLFYLTPSGVELNFQMPGIAI